MVNFSQPTGDTKDTDNNWTQVQNKKSNSGQVRNKSENSNLVKTKVSITLRVPKDKPNGYSVAEIHLAMIKEMCKQDNKLIMFYFARVSPTYNILTKNAKNNTRKIIKKMQR
jgi:hypothetical protein